VEEAGCMSESSDYKTFRRNVIGPHDRIDRIENVMVAGMPDVNFCIDGVEGWIEQKSPKEPKRKSTKLFGSNHKVSVDQSNWMKRQTTAGGKAYFLIVTDLRWLLLDGAWADEINNMSVNQIVAASAWHYEKPIRDKEAWEQLKAILQT
jgi:hypothetical protein